MKLCVEIYDKKLGVLQLNRCDKMIGFRGGFILLPRSGLLEQPHSL